MELAVEKLWRFVGRPKRPVLEANVAPNGEQPSWATCEERYWLDRAEEARVIAEELNDSSSELLLSLAEEYEQRAALAKAAFTAPMRVRQR